MVMYKPSGTRVRSVIAIAIGAMLIKWADKVTDTLVVILGIMLIVPLLSALITYAVQRSKNMEAAVFPIIGGAGSAVADNRSARVRRYRGCISLLHNACAAADNGCPYHSQVPEHGRHAMDNSRDNPPDIRFVGDFQPDTLQKQGRRA